jgi:hypothetical protein
LLFAKEGEYWDGAEEEATFASDADFETMADVWSFSEPQLELVEASASIPLTPFLLEVNVVVSWFQESHEHFPVFATSMMIRRNSLGNGPSPKRFPEVATVLPGIEGASLFAAALNDEEDKDNIFVVL